MKKFLIILISAILMSIYGIGGYRLTLPSFRKIIDSLGEIADILSDLTQDIHLVKEDQKNESCLYLSGSSFI